MPQAGAIEHIYDPSVSPSEPWYYNDHSFIRDRDGIWHVFAITHAKPEAPMDEREFGHATSPSLTSPTWTKQPPALVLDESLGERVLWAPHVIEHDGTYYMFYCAGGEPDRHRMRLATSSNSYDWTRVPEPLFEDGAWARDPFVVRIGEQWVMYYTATREPTVNSNFVVAYRTSADLLHWGPRQIAFSDPMKGMAAGTTESPFVVQRPEGYYLFLSLRDNEYNKTEAFFSRDPFHFEVDPLSALPVHAGELVQDDGAWYISHCGWYAAGLYIAPLRWSCD